MHQPIRKSRISSNAAVQPRAVTTTIHLQLPRLHRAQRMIVAQAKRYNVVCAGRRTGKTTLGVDRLIHAALRGQPVAWMSPTYRMLSEVWRTVSQTLSPITTRRSEQHYRLELITGGVIDMWSLDHADAVRGRKYQRVVIDEAAMVRHLRDAWQQVIRPTLSDLGGDAWLLSSPRGRNFFWECWQRGQAHEDPEWASWKIPTMANPYIAAEEIAAMQRELPEQVYHQEVLAQFLDDGNGVFRRVLECATAEPLATPLPDASYVMGCDWARAEQGDSTVVTIMDSGTRTMVALERWNGMSYAQQLDKLRVLAERWKPRCIVAEANNMGSVLVETLQRDYGETVVGVVTTNQTKATWVDRLALAFEQGTITILNTPILIGELLAFEATRLPSGLLRYAAPSGGHDDCVISLMLALHGCEHVRSPLFW